MRTGILSDAAHAKNCAKYQPIPMREAERILKMPKQETDEVKFVMKLAKYKAPVIRPATFDTLAQTLARIGNSSSLREALDDTYSKDIAKLTDVLHTLDDKLDLNYDTSWSWALKSMVQLKGELRHRNLKVGGNKAALVARLAQSDKDYSMADVSMADATPVEEEAAKDSTPQTPLPQTPLPQIPGTSNLDAVLKYNADKSKGIN